MRWGGGGTQKRGPGASHGFWSPFQAQDELEGRYLVEGFGDQDCPLERCAPAIEGLSTAAAMERRRVARRTPSRGVRMGFGRHCPVLPLWGFIWTSPFSIHNSSVFHFPTFFSTFPPHPHSPPQTRVWSPRLSSLLGSPTAACPPCWLGETLCTSH